MKKASHHILRVGLAVTFLWIGLLVIKNPSSWSIYIRPWIDNLLPLTSSQILIFSGIFNLVLGLWMLLDIKMWLSALVAVIFMSFVLAISGINSTTISGVSILTAAIALFYDSYPRHKIPDSFHNRRHKPEIPEKTS